MDDRGTHSIAQRMISRKEGLFLQLVHRKQWVDLCLKGLTIHWQNVEKFMEKEMATHSSILAWRILWMEEPGGLLSIGSHRVRHDWLACMHALEKEMATHSSILAWRIPRTEEPAGLPSMGLHRVGHNLAAAAEKFKCKIGKRKLCTHK